MQTIDIHTTKLIIIGNGFDLNLGLKTAYCDFLESNYFAELLKEKNPFAEALKNKFNLNRWIDVEIELKEISQTYTTISASHFKQLCEKLMEYMSQMELPNSFENTYAYKLISDECTGDFVILDFNYTDSVAQLLKKTTLFFSTIESSIIKMHGSVKEKAIIFGVEDEAKLDSKHIYLQKSFHKNFKGINLTKHWGSVREIHIFGHSLGETDHPYFAKFFKAASQGEYNSLETHLNLYHFGENSYEDLMRQIDKMTNRNLRSLRQNIHFNPIDVQL